ncbi:MAG: DsrE family protein [bacterium]
MKKIVILSTKPPYGSSISAEAFRAGLGLAFSEMQVDLILIGDGVYGAIKDQSPAKLQMKPISDIYNNIADYKISLFLLEDSIQERNLQIEQLVNANIISCEELKKMITNADVVLTF